MIELLSVELTNRCGKMCRWCYNASNPQGETKWKPQELISFVRDCAENGTVKALSLGGGEPLEYDGLIEVLDGLKGRVFLSMTTNGLHLDGLVHKLAGRIDKIHVSIHFPGNQTEVDRVIRQVQALADAGIRSGINFLVSKSNLKDCPRAARKIRDAGIAPERVVFLPMRVFDTPTPKELADVAKIVGDRWQSTFCLLGCKKSPRFLSIGWDKKVAWCSYTKERRLIDPLTWEGLQKAIDGMGLIYCGNERREELVKV